jgi:peptidyl-dipeptidase A
MTARQPSGAPSLAQLLLVSTTLLILLLQPSGVQLASSRISSSGSSSSSSRRHQAHDAADRVDENLVQLEQELDLYIRKLTSGAKSACSLTNEAEDWVNGLDETLKTLLNELGNANWNYTTNLTDENAAKLEVVQSRLDNLVADDLQSARQFLQNASNICNATALRLIRLFSNYMIPPVADDPNTRSRINQLVNSMSETYSTAFITDSEGRENRLDPELTEIMATSRDYDQLVWAWQGWRNVTGHVMKARYVELVDKMNEAAVDNGYADVGLAWQMTDFDETDVEQMMLTIYEQVKPFYEQLHAYVRRKLAKVYPNRGVRTTGKIPAHLLGDMWAQEWSNIADLVLPYPTFPDIDVTAELHRNNFTVLRMFQVAEDFFTSIGLEPMTQDFWSKSVMVRPTDGRPLSCHGSAEDFYKEV